MVADASNESRPESLEADSKTRTQGIPRYDLCDGTKTNFIFGRRKPCFTLIDEFIKEKRIYASAVEEQGLLETVVEQDFKYYKLTYRYYRCKHGILAKPTTLLLTLSHIISGDMAAIL
ncbi:hypothetical protein JTB14_023008 [Gonioctena quinquepunctata]|nr:hypothetical protein JTB14_023008 [Gonioctena quinquepunctata]